jgi:muramidase (phage lysozyme)
MDANGTKDSRVSKSQEDTEDREAYDNNGYSVSVIGNEDILDYSDVPDVIICIVRDPSEFVN